jgi:replicative DNA helicase
MIFENYNQNRQSTERRSRFTNPTPFSGLGKLPPQAIDLEEAVLGSLMLEKVPQEIFNMVRPEYFYVDKHQRIYHAIVQVRGERSPVDILTVTAKLRKMGELEMIGGAYYITELTNRVASASNIEFHIRIIHEAFLKREIIRIGTQGIQESYEDTTDVFDSLIFLLKELSDLKNNIYKRSEKRADQLIYEAVQEMNRPKPKGLLGLSTGFRGIDHITQGDQESQLIIEAARPGMGKTAKMCSEMLNCCFDPTTQQPLQEQIPVACFSLEMRAVQLTFRMVSNMSEIPNLKIKKNLLTPDEHIRFNDFAERFAAAPIFIDDTPGLTIDEFEIKAAILVALYGVRKIYIDYLQLMKGERGKKYSNRDAEIGDITRRLKTCANELGITIIVACQLNREVEKRKWCMPTLADLRESGSIEQDADIVRFLWRPEYYPEVMKDLTGPEGKIRVELFNFDITNFEGVIFCIIAKCREERTGKVPLKFRGNIMRVADNKTVLDIIDALESNLFTPELDYISPF